MIKCETTQETLGETGGKALSSCLWQVVLRSRVPRVCGDYQFTPLSPVALGMHTGGTSRLYSDQATHSWSEPPTDSRLALRANCLTRPCRGPQFLEQAKLGTLERARLEPTTFGLQVPHSIIAPRLLRLRGISRPLHSSDSEARENHTMIWICPSVDTVAQM